MSQFTQHIKSSKKNNQRKKNQAKQINTHNTCNKLMGGKKERTKRNKKKETGCVYARKKREPVSLTGFFILGLVSLVAVVVVVVFVDWANHLQYMQYNCIRYN